MNCSDSAVRSGTELKRWRYWIFADIPIADIWPLPTWQYCRYRHKNCLPITDMMIWKNANMPILLMPILYRHVFRQNYANYMDAKKRQLFRLYHLHGRTYCIEAQGSDITHDYQTPKCDQAKTKRPLTSAANDFIKFPGCNSGFCSWLLNHLGD